MGYDTTLMLLLQIGETLNKLKDTKYANKLPIKDASDLRNFWSMLRAKSTKLKANKVYCLFFSKQLLVLFLK